MIKDALAQLEPAQGSSDRRHSILIVDDDQTQVEVLTHRLQHQGFNTVSAYEGRVGLRKAASTAPIWCCSICVYPIWTALRSANSWSIHRKRVTYRSSS